MEILYYLTPPIILEIYYCKAAFTLIYILIVYILVYILIIHLIHKQLSLYINLYIKKRTRFSFAQWQFILDLLPSRRDKRDC